MGCMEDNFLHYFKNNSKKKSSKKIIFFHNKFNFISGKYIKLLYINFLYNLKFLHLFLSYVTIGFFCICWAYRIVGLL